MSNFSYSHSVFKRLLLQTRKIQGLFGKGLKEIFFERPFSKFVQESFTKTLWKKVKLLKTSNFTFFRNVFYAIYILKSFNYHISVAVCSFFEFGTVSTWCIGEWLKLKLHILNFLKISRVMMERPNIAIYHVREFSNFVREMSGNFISSGLLQA